MLTKSLYHLMSFTLTAEWFAPDGPLFPFVFIYRLHLPTIRIREQPAITTKNRVITQSALDLMDVMAMFNGRNFQKLDVILPGLLGFQASVVKQVIISRICTYEQWLKLTSYCEGDVLVHGWSICAGYY